MILIAESGSTKCDWVLLDGSGNELNRWKTIGFNPYFHTAEEIVSHLSNTKEVETYRSQVRAVYFYGAGCNTSKLKMIIKNALDQVFIHSQNEIGHDLEAAAFSVYEGAPLIACIIGTGSNSCFFDGEKISENTPALAFILGDEGSASYIGKRLVTDFLYGKMPQDIACDFKDNYPFTKDEVIDRVYHQCHPNVYLASFGIFAGKHSKTPYIRNIVKEGFDTFIENHVACYSNANQVKVSFVGSVAQAYQGIMEECLRIRGFKLGEIVAQPIDSLVTYHIKQLQVS